MKHLAIIFVLTLTTASLSGCNLQNNQNNVMESDAETNTTVVEENEVTAEVTTEVAVETHDEEDDHPHEVTEKGEVIHITAEPQYIAFSQSKHAQLLGNTAHVISFHADWCPTCNLIDKQINAELSSFPEGTLILKANYDKEGVTKQKYGVKSQSTFVIIDANGNYVETLAAPSTSELKAAITASL